MLKSIKKLSEHNAKIIAVAITILVAYLSLRSKGVDIELPIKNADKIFHFSACFLLTTAWLYALRHKNGTTKVVIALILYGIFLEFAQEWFTENRTKDIFDALANSLGIIIATIVFKYFNNNFVKKFG